MSEKETICWDCQNYSRCSWSRGKPVKGWKATPTVIEQMGGSGMIKTHSYLVEDCPHFERDKKRRATAKEIGKIIGRSATSVLSLISRKGVGFVTDELKEKGYKLHVCKGKELNTYYLEKLK